MPCFRVFYLEIGSRAKLSYYCQATDEAEAETIAKQRARLTAGQWFITDIIQVPPHREGTFAGNA